ncbi:zeta toxin family protein [Ornithinimicrobium sp. F0845]|uniref:zeta toxin family protein n=1 Tax=Ornithinimicrobium sp. F0845 TaxID=2926412 RepID=UPI001FF2D4A3|nr:zeta toxin family protein [Ornithinimicrobium sp. F0845]MCK0111548.1 zeta toxin family protein [Ornithinimicrobium sp. F0845]
MPQLHLLAGPNGAGKSSYVRDVLAPATGLPFVNADEIAAARWAGAQAEHSYEAARIAEAQRREHIAGGTSFISETVFSHPSKVQLVADAIEAGYLVHLHVIIIPVELAVQRVLERERRGGHSVPERKIRERHERLWAHVDAAIQLADLTDVFDNSSARTPFRRCATFAQGTLIGTPAWPRWTPAVLRQGPSGRHQTDD